MSYLIILIAIIIIGVTIFTVIEDKIKNKDEEPEELTEQEKTMRAARVLIYIVITLIIAYIAWKFLLIKVIADL